MYHLHKKDHYMSNKPICPKCTELEEKYAVLAQQTKTQKRELQTVRRDLKIAQKRIEKLKVQKNKLLHAKKASATKKIKIEPGKSPKPIGFFPK